MGTFAEKARNQANQINFCSQLEKLKVNNIS